MSTRLNKIDLRKGDCFKVLQDLEENSVDLILTDFPYGVLNSRNEWDKIPNLEPLWREFNRVAKENAAIITTAKQPFTSKLIMSNLKDFKYCLIWEKSKATGYLNAKKIPLVAHEDIVVFYRKMPTYNPQMTEGAPYNKGTAVRDTEAYAKQDKAIEVRSNGSRYPRSVVYFRTAESEGKHHPTQKPIALFDWLVRTYSNSGDVVLDPFMGSGTTGIAAIENGRSFIGIEKMEKYYQIALERINGNGAKSNKSRKGARQRGIIYG